MKSIKIGKGTFRTESDNKKGFTQSDVKKASSLVVTDPNTDEILRQIIPSNLEVGIENDNRFKNSLSVEGVSILKGGSIMNTGGYINWGNDSGSDGYGIRENLGNIQIKNIDSDAWSNISTSQGAGDITSVVAGNGITGGGSSGEVTVTVQAADSTISVASGGLSVSESNLSGIPNGALSNNTISGVSLGSNLNNLTIGNGIQLNTGTTYNGSSAVTLSIQASDSTISIASGGISVDESNLSSISNGSLSNSTISGVSLGSNLNNLTISTGLGLDSGSTYNGSSARTITNTGVTQITAGSGISISGGTGNVTVTNSTGSPDIRAITSKATIAASDASSPVVINFLSSVVANSSVVSGHSNGTFTIASTGVYKINISGVIASGSDAQNASNVSLVISQTDGSNTSNISSSTIPTLTDQGTRINFQNQYISFSDDGTKSIQIKIAYTANGGGITTSTDLGGYPLLIEITKAS